MNLAPLPKQPTSIVFLGTPLVAAQSLRRLIEAGIDVRLVITGVPKRRGRGSSVEISPVHQVADEAGIVVAHDLAILDETTTDEGGPLVGFVVAFGSILPEALLNRVPFVNLHFSKLPRWRGAAPVERAILAGDPEVGVCLMRIDKGLDEGAIIGSLSIPLDDAVSAEAVRSELCRLGTDMFISQVREGFGTENVQVGEPSYAKKIGAGDRRIDWHGSAVQAARVVRIGGAFTEVDGQRLKVVDGRPSQGGPLPGEVALRDSAVVVGCGEGSLQLIKVQPEGKAVMDAMAWWNGHGRVLSSKRLGG